MKNVLRRNFREACYTVYNIKYAQEDHRSNSEDISFPIFDQSSKLYCIGRLI